MIIDNRGRFYKMKMFILSVFFLIKWYNKYIVNSLEFIILVRLNNYGEGRVKKVGYKEDGEWTGG